MLVTTPAVRLQAQLQVLRDKLLRYTTSSQRLHCFPRNVQSGAKKPPTMTNDFKGNKQSLPNKPCALCGRTMTWRKAWSKNWDSVLYCSAACRAKKPGKQTP